jgi:hypothetical protein
MANADACHDHIRSHGVHRHLMIFVTNARLSGCDLPDESRVAANSRL